MEVYRLILFTPRAGNYPEGGTYDTGATYSGCNQANPDACQPRQFARLQDVLDYTKAKGEIPVKVSSEQQAWDIIAGESPVNDSMIVSENTGSFAGMSMMTILGLGLGAIFLVPMLFRGRR